MKEILTKILNGKEVEIGELVSLLNHFYYIETGKDPDPKALYAAIQSGVFNIDYIIDTISSNPQRYKFYINKLYSKRGDFIRGEVIEL